MTVVMPDGTPHRPEQKPPHKGDMPVFPFQVQQHNGVVVIPGLTLRDLYAAVAMHALIMDFSVVPAIVALRAYGVADAMIDAKLGEESE